MYMCLRQAAAARIVPTYRMELVNTTISVTVKTNNLWTYYNTVKLSRIASEVFKLIGLEIIASLA